MGTTAEDIGRWFDEGVEEGATHMLVVCDTFDYEDYPVFVKKGQDVKKVYQSYLNGEHSMQRVMEVYSLAKDKKEQLGRHRVFDLD